VKIDEFFEQISKKVELMFKQKFFNADTKLKNTKLKPYEVKIVDLNIEKSLRSEKHFNSTPINFKITRINNKKDNFQHNSRQNYSRDPSNHSYYRY